MKGFIEVSASGNTQLVNVGNITSVSGRNIFLTNGNVILCDEPYVEIKEKIRDAFLGV